MRSSVPVTNRRRILCVFPRYTPSFGTFSHAYPLMNGVRAFMPPQGLLLIAAYMPETWPVRFIDENIAPATAADFAWADAVLVSGMHVQAPQIHDIRERAQGGRQARWCSAGRPYPASPEMYPDIDYLHIGEIGDATDALIARLDESCARPPRRCASRPRSGCRSAISRSLPMTMVPLERLPDAARLQFSSGCPYRCEFCDIPALYGRQPRLKTPEQLIAELDAMRGAARASAGRSISSTTISSATGRPTREMLPHLVAWQKQHGYPAAVRLRGDAQHRQADRRSSR